MRCGAVRVPRLLPLLAGGPRGRPCRRGTGVVERALDGEHRRGAGARLVQHPDRAGSDRARTVAGARPGAHADDPGSGSWRRCSRATCAAAAGRRSRRARSGDSPRSAAAEQKFIVANGDEGDPGSYIDKYLMERNPELVLEGMALAGYAVGADHGFILTRSEYPRSKPALEQAVESARREGQLGRGHRRQRLQLRRDRARGRGLVRGRRGDGAAGLPRGTAGNGVRATAVPGRAWPVRRADGRQQRRDARQHPVHRAARSRRLPAAEPGRLGRLQAGLLQRALRLPGGVRGPLRGELRELCEGLAGGIDGGIKAVQIGGPLGGILPSWKLDTPFDFDALAAEGCMVGHGSIVGFDERTDMRALARHLLRFGAHESCGKCFPCRIGLRRAHEMFEADAPVDRAQLEACWRPWRWPACAPTAAACRPRSAACSSISPRSWG